MENKECVGQREEATLVELVLSVLFVCKYQQRIVESAGYARTRDGERQVETRQSPTGMLDFQRSGVRNAVEEEPRGSGMRMEKNEEERKEERKRERREKRRSSDGDRARWG